MKKIALMALGLTGVLASCGGGVSTENPPRTDFRLAEKVTYDNGTKSLAAGTYIICNNLPTGVEATIQTDPGVSSFLVIAKGVEYGKEVTVREAPADTDGQTSVTFKFNPGVAPLSLDAQSIVVNPKPVKNVNVIGFTDFGVRTFDANGNILSQPDFGDFKIPVVDRCSVL